MKRDFEVVIKNFDGRPYTRPMFKWDAKTGLPITTADGQPVFDKHEAMTLRTFALDALAGVTGLSNEELWAHKTLHDKIAFADKGIVELTTKEGEMILTALNKQGRTAIVVGAMQELLNNDPSPPTA